MPLANVYVSQLNTVNIKTCGCNSSDFLDILSWTSRINKGYVFPWFAVGFVHFSPRTCNGDAQETGC